jgi:hypothetical protein
MRSRARFWNRLLQFLRLKPYETAIFKVAVPKSDILELPHIKHSKKTRKKQENISFERENITYISVLPQARGFCCHRLDKSPFRLDSKSMKKFLAAALFLCWGGLLFGQISLGLGFQYGTARVFDQGETLREMNEPGVLLSFRFVPAQVGLFARLGILFPSRISEGGVTLSYSDYDYILFLNGGLGPSFTVPINDRFSFIFDAGISINDLLYGGSYKSDIDATWEIKFSNMGQTYIQTGGQVFKDVKMKETHNDVSFGLLGNAAMRFKFTQNIYMELGVAASFDFLRLRTYKFSADFRNQDPDWHKDFPNGKLDDPANPKELILETDSKFSVFKQFTFIPSLSVGFSF